MENISGTGMRFESAQEFLVASLVEIRFLLGLKFVTEVQCRGVVVRQCASDNAKYGIATQFLSYGIGPPGKAVPDQFPIQELHASKHNLSQGGDRINPHQQYGPANAASRGEG